MAAPTGRQPAAKPALAPDALIATGKDARIRLIEKRPPRRKKRPATPQPGRPSPARNTPDAEDVQPPGPTG